MKKFYTAALSVCLVFILSACVLSSNVRLNSAQVLGELHYKVPSKWKLVQNAGGNYYYLSDNSLDGFLYVSRQVIAGMDAYDVSDKDVAYAIIDSVVSGLISAAEGYESIEEVQSKIDNKIYYTLLDFKSAISGYDCEVVTIIFLSDTSVYQISFIQQEEISNDNKEVFYNIIDTIELDDLKKAPI